MLVGLVTEIKPGERRCALTPTGARGIVHYCVANMPGAVPRSATRALTDATLPYVRALADLGLDELCAQDPGVAPGVLVRDGRLISELVPA